MPNSPQRAAARAASARVAAGVVDDLLAELAGSLELLAVPEEGGGRREVPVGGHLFAVVHFEGERVDRLLVDHRHGRSRRAGGAGGRRLTRTS